MKIKLDENMPHALVGFLESSGHDVETVQAEGLLNACGKYAILNSTNQ